MTPKTHIPHPVEIHIRNMVCPRCVMAVTDTLRRHGLLPTSVTLGRAVLSEAPSAAVLAAVSRDLHAIGFELAEGADERTVMAVKECVMQAMRGRLAEGFRLSDHVARTLRQDYTTLSRLFSSLEGRTIESYAIAQRVARAQELLEDDALSVKEVAYMLGYSGVAHFSRQFKQTVGLTPTAWRQGEGRPRPAIDSI